MPLANPTRCWECEGWGSVSFFNHVLGKPQRLVCLKCRGTGQLCMDCYNPEGACECPAEPEPCPICGKLACRCI